MDEGRKRVLAIVAGILVARHLKTTDDLFDSRPSPRTGPGMARRVLRLMASGDKVKSFNWLTTSRSTRAS